MPVAAKRKLATTSPEKATDLSAFVPRELFLSEDPQTLIPRLAKDCCSVRANSLYSNSIKSRDSFSEA